MKTMDMTGLGLPYNFNDITAEKHIIIPTRYHFYQRKDFKIKQTKRKFHPTNTAYSTYTRIQKLH